MDIGGSLAAVRRVAVAPALRRVNLAFLAYSVGEHATWLAVAVYALGRGGPGLVGVVAAAQLAPGVLLTPFSSYAGDRFRPRRALAAGYAVQCAGMAATAVAMAAGRGIEAYAAGAVAATAISFTRPVMGALLPVVTHAPADLVAANVVAGVIEQAGIFGGPLLAGVGLAVASPAAVFAGAAVLTGAACAAVARSPGDDDGPGASTAVVASRREAVRRLAGGFTELRRSGRLRILIAFVAAAGLVRGVGDVTFVTFAGERLRAGGGASGYLAMVYGVGGLAAAGAATRLARIRRTAQAFLVAAGAAVAGLVVLAVAASYASSGAGFALAGAGDALLMLAAVVTIQRTAPSEVLGRLFGIVEGTRMGCIALGSTAVSLLTASASLGAGFAGMAAAVGLVGLVAAALLRRAGDEVEPVDDALVGRLLADPVFAALPAPAIERLAREATVLRAAAGDRVVAEGEVGDRYYLVVGGTVDVTIAGDHVRALGPGSSFGEIALLRDVPRTATAIAAGDVELLAVGRDAFLTAVTGHPRALRTASDVAERWLPVG